MYNVHILTLRVCNFMLSYFNQKIPLIKCSINKREMYGV